MSAVRERSGGWCELRIPGVCQGRGVCGHEKRKRSQGGDPTDPENVMHSCIACNGWVEERPREAAERQVSISKKYPVGDHIVPAEDPIGLNEFAMDPEQQQRLRQNNDEEREPYPFG